MKRSELYLSYLSLLKTEKTRLGKEILDLVNARDSYDLETFKALLEPLQARMAELKTESVLCDHIRQRAHRGEHSWIPGYTRHTKRTREILTPFNNPDILPPGYQHP